METLVNGLWPHYIKLNSNVMMSRQIQILLQRSKTTTHLLQLHSLILKTAIDHNPDLISQFIFSISSVSIEFARLVFDRLPIRAPIFAWNSIIRAYTKSSVPIEAVKLFSQMQRVGLKPDNFTYPFVVKACGRSLVVGAGGAMHSIIVKAGFDSDRYVGNTLLRMYANLNAVGLARRVFNEMTVRDVVSWSSMIAGYVACNCQADALMVFRHMMLANEKPNSVTLDWMLL